MRMIKFGWKNTDDKIRMTKCGWKNADDKVRMENCQWHYADDKIPIIEEKLNDDVSWKSYL